MEKPEAKFVFAVAEEDFGDLGKHVTVQISDRAYFEKEGFCSDWHLSEEDGGEWFEELGLGEEAEGYFSLYDESLTVDEVRAMLNERPEMYECPKFAAFLKNLG